MMHEHFSEDTKFIDPWKDDDEDDLSMARAAYIRLGLDIVPSSGRNHLTSGNEKRMWATTPGTRAKSKLVSTNDISQKGSALILADAVRASIRKMVADKRLAWISVFIFSTAYVAGEFKSGNFNAAAIVLSIVSIFGFAAEHFSGDD